MNFEKNKFQQIKVENKEELEEKIERRLFEVQLDFACSKAESDSKADLQERGSGGKISSLIEKETSLLDNLRKYFFQILKTEKENLSEQEFNQELCLALKPTLEKIDTIYGQRGLGWKDALYNFLKIEEERVSSMVVGKETIKNYAGLLNYSLHEHDPDAERMGINSREACFAVHFEEFYKKEKSELSLSLIRKSLEEVAEKIIVDYPQVQVVTGESWLLDSSLAKRLGFEIIKGTDSLDQKATWWQFIDKNGQLKLKALKSFYEKESLPHKVAKGFIPVPDFLEEYLPAGKRGEIKLKKLSLEFKEGYDRIQELGKKFKSSFEKLSEDEVRSFFDSEKLLVEYFTTIEGRKLMDFLIEMKRKRYSFKQIEETEPERIKSLGENLQDFIDQKKFVDYKIKI